MSRTTRFAIISCFIFSLFGFIPAPGMAGNRLAGSMPGKHTGSAPTSHLGNVDLPQLESLGFTHEPGFNALPLTLWDGTKRADIESSLIDLPGDIGNAVIYDTVKRVLLSRIDSRMVKESKRPQPGHDLLTLRLEALIRIGAFEEAATLYTRMTEPPYHERLARAGILAFLFSGQPTLACLEGFSLEDRFSRSVDPDFDSAAFWSGLDNACRIINDLPVAEPEASKDGEEKTAAYPLLDKFIYGDNYVFTPQTVDQLQTLPLLTYGILSASGRINYSRLTEEDTLSLPPFILAVALQDKGLPPGLRMRFLIAAVKAGLRHQDDLEEFYESVAFPIIETEAPLPGTLLDDIAGWKRLPYLYQTLRKIHGEIDSTLIVKTLREGNRYGLVSLLPFADIIRSTPPETLSSEKAVRAALHLLLLTDSPLPDSWRDFWRAQLSSENNQDDVSLFLLYAAGVVGHQPPALPAGEDKDISFDYNALSPYQHAILHALFEKLDTDAKLHNIDADSFYENPEGLTFGEDYVMPSESLVQRLRTAAKKGHTGEVVLLSGILFKKTPSAKINGELMQEILDSYTFVGLIKEAQLFTKEVILSLDNK
ncbi:MAG: hypothetical protein H6868_06280 [Rhodospirillales bacterium]|nr:hypothetical protein [Rhodospirillales bacterium]